MSCFKAELRLFREIFATQQTGLYLQAVIEQVAHDHALLRERIQRLGGSQGLVRLEAALNLARAQVAAAAEAQQEKQQSPEKERKDGPTPSKAFADL